MARTILWPENAENRSQGRHVDRPMGTAWAPSTTTSRRPHARAHDLGPGLTVPSALETVRDS